MENVADALKLAFGIFVFALAVMLTFSVIGQARATSDAISQMNDKTEYLEYATNQDYNAKENRMVGLETILPTIHRYAKEQYAVTIFNTDGTPIVRYDLYTEGFMANWKETLKNISLGKEASRVTYQEVKKRLDPVQYVVNKDLNTNVNIMDFIDGNLYYGTADVPTFNIVSPWMGDPDNDTVDRIKCDMIPNGKYAKNGITYYGKNLLQYKNRKFKEKFIEIATSGETITDGNDSIETIRGNKKLEIIYILQP